jgi:hypothetical protein
MRFQSPQFNSVGQTLFHHGFVRLFVVEGKWKGERSQMKRIFSNILLLLLLALPLKSAFGEVFISVNFAPPALPVYEQPVCPGDGFIWIPGYWAWDVDDGYYWIPGYWETAPEVGFLWTPAWWGWDGGVFVFHEGYWGPHVGFYGGVNYGFGYFGTGFAGGRWDGGHFFYNAAVLNVGVNIHNTYRDTTIINNTTIVNNHVSYNGGEGGIAARPTAQEESYEHEQHVAPSAAQLQHVQAARANPQLRASVNQGRPSIAATDRAGSFSGHGAVAATAAGGEYHAPAGAPGGEAHPRPEAGRPGAPEAEHSNTPTHASDLQPHQPEQLQPSGDMRTDRENQKQQQKMIDQQNKEHQRLEKQQQKEDQQAQKHNYSDEQKQQMEQRHQQQTQDLEQRHQQQTQQFQSHMQAPPQRKPH